MRNLPDFSVRNPVAVNLLMFFLIVVGAYFALNLTREFFPPTDAEIIYVGMAYPGSTPEEVERGISKRIEDAIIDLEGIDKITTTISEGNSAMLVKVLEGADKKKLLDEIQREVDRITDFPEEALEPIVIDVAFTMPVISVVIYGPAGERRLKKVAEEVEDEIRDHTTIASLNKIGARRGELAVEMDPALLEAYNLTFGEVSQAIRQSNLDLPAGEIKAPGGAILVRTLGESDAADRLRDVVIRSLPNGAKITLDQVANVADTFTESKQLAYFRGEQAVVLTIFKNHEQDAFVISNAVKEVVAKFSERFAGDAIQLEARADSTRFIQQRQNMLLRNGLQGLFLVFLCLAFFLDFRVAKWTAVGLPISFMGTFIAMHFIGVTVNMISLFGLIIVIGIIVDDAIVIGENIFRYYQEGVPPHRAAIEGAREVTWPVILTVTTTVIAFAPLIFLKGVIGDFLGVLPLVVIAALTVSLVEALVILPTHLAESLEKSDRKRRIRERLSGRTRTLKNSKWNVLEKWRRVEEKKERFLEVSLPNSYVKVLRVVLHWRYVFIAGMISIMMITMGFIGSGLIKFVFLQDTDSETIIVELDMGAGTLAQETRESLDLIRVAGESFEEVDSMTTLIGVKFTDDGAFTDGTSEGQGQMIIDLIGAEDRDERGLMASDQFIAAMREKVGDIPGAKTLKFTAAQGGPPGADIELEIRHPRYESLTLAAADITERLSSFRGVADIEDTLQVGKSEVRLKLRPSAEALGLTTLGLAQQIRGAFFGDEAQSLQRDREEVKVYTRLRYDDRTSIDALEKFRIKTPQGDRVPLGEIAEIDIGRGYARLTRIDGRRAVRITADVDETVGNTSEITTAIIPFLDELRETYPGLTYEFAGDKKETADAFSSIQYGAPLAFMAIFCLLAVMFKSYLQPLIIMSAIPFGLVGAVWGHPIMGYPLTILSFIGIVALSGIVVNDSLILVDFINAQVRRGVPLLEAVVNGGRLRLRAIMLTSLTTVFGLGPLMMERSFQAQFLIPMAISISFGLAFATIIILFLVPALYLVLEDSQRVVKFVFTGKWGPPSPIGMRQVKLERAIEKSYAEQKGPRFVT